MNCEQSQAGMIDVLYGEEVNPRLGFEFFQHLSQCSECNREYGEMVETREMLGEWKVEHQLAHELETRPAAFAFRRWSLGRRGYADQGVVAGDDADAALHRYLDRTRGAIRQSPMAPSPPPSPPPVPEPRS